MFGSNKANISAAERKIGFNAIRYYFYGLIFAGLWLWIFNIHFLAEYIAQGEEPPQAKPFNEKDFKTLGERELEFWTQEYKKALSKVKTKEDLSREAWAAFPDTSNKKKEFQEVPIYYGEMKDAQRAMKAWERKTGKSFLRDHPTMKPYKGGDTIGDFPKRGTTKEKLKKDYVSNIKKHNSSFNDLVVNGDYQLNFFKMSSTANPFYALVLFAPENIAREYIYSKKITITAQERAECASDLRRRKIEFTNRSHKNLGKNHPLNQFGNTPPELEGFCKSGVKFNNRRFSLNYGDGVCFAAYNMNYKFNGHLSIFVDKKSVDLSLNKNQLTQGECGKPWRDWAAKVYHSNIEQDFIKNHPLYRILKLINLDINTEINRRNNRANLDNLFEENKRNTYYRALLRKNKKSEEVKVANKILKFINDAKELKLLENRQELLEEARTQHKIDSFFTRAPSSLHIILRHPCLKTHSTRAT